MPINRLFVTVPNFKYAGDYFPQIVSALRLYGRTYSPEITNEDPRDPFMQGERAFSLVAHYNNVLLDMVANGLYLRTSTVPESVKLILELINSQLYPAGPARVDMVAELSSTYSTTTRLLEAYRKFATRRNADLPETVYENIVAIDTTKRTNQLGHAYALQFDRWGVTSATVSSIQPDRVTDLTAPFLATDLNHYMTVSGSVLGNNEEDLRIIELLDEGPVGQYSTVRLENASFISEDNLSWIIKKISSDIATNWATGVATDPLPGGMISSDMIYIGHPDVMFDRVDMTLSAPVTPGYEASWEFYDPTDSTVSPDEIVLGTGNMDVYLDTLLGTDNRQMALVEVEYIPTGAKYKGFTTYSGGRNYITVESHMGQSPTPSTEAGDYLVGCKWRPLPDIDDETLDASSTWAETGKFEFTLPQSQLNSWYKKRLYDHAAGEEKSAFFIRMRLVSSLGSSAPIPSTVEIHRGKEYIITTVIQGKTVEDSPIGSSDGSASQEFALTQKPYVLASARVFVDEGGGEIEYAVKSTLVRSGFTDRDCVVEPQTDGTAVLTFGDGTNGKIPPLGSNNIRVMYRIGADTNGNIGANTLTENRDGIGVFKRVWNPRQGRYWIEADWASPAALERAKVRGPKKLRTMSRAVSASDCEVLAATFKTRNGIRPVARAVAYEEAFGPKTIELVIAGVNGASLTSDERAELEEYFNGGTTYGYPGVVMANHRVYVSNYQPKLIPFSIRAEAYAVITEEMVKQLMSSVVNPTALDIDGRSYIWRFGQTVPLSRLGAEVFRLSPGNIFDVDFISPSLDIGLSSRELPLFDFANSTVVIASPSFIES